ncbi:hypothetical protein [Marinobacter salicampi]|uniref:hypothetical protein n=1 Tax=Marinobacter salicampi TaxID=435907 RepID=UPI00140D086B|nr:hypothetical protein [Marinobacter salicampi]
MPFSKWIVSVVLKLLTKSVRSDQKDVALIFFSQPLAFEAASIQIFFDLEYRRMAVKAY